MYKVFESDDMCICNVADTFYVVFDFHQFLGMQFGYIGGGKMVSVVAGAPENIYKYLEACGKGKINDRLFLLCNDTLKQVREFKKQTMVQGPEPCIDYKLEAELMRLSNDRRNKR